MRLTRGLRGGGSLSLLSCSCSSTTGLRSQHRLLAAPKVSAFSLLLYRNWTQRHMQSQPEHETDKPADEQQTVDEHSSHHDLNPSHAILRPIHRRNARHPRRPTPPAA